MTTGPEVRPYTPADREALLRIAADTAFFGAPLEAYLDDRRLFCDFFYAYYTDLEPEHAWVACADGQVVGFLTGCTDTAARSRRWVRLILPGLAGRLLGGHYRLGRKTWRYVVRLATARPASAPDLRAYPAHLHVNLAEGWRGRGLGRGLIEACLGQMHALGLPGIHLSTTSVNLAACRLYAALGFRLLAVWPTRLWEGLVEGPVDERVYGLDLRQGS